MAYQLYVAEFPNGKRYFGITGRSLTARIKAHWDCVRRPRYPVHKALKKYGTEVVFRTLAVGERFYIADLEIKAIALFRTRDRQHGYNVTLGGDLSPMATPEVAARAGLRHRGKVISEEMRQALRAARLGWKHTSETKARIRAAHKGRVIPRHIVEAIAEKNRGRKASAETRGKLSAALMGNRRAAGKKWTEERRELGRLASTGRRHSEATKALLSEMKTGITRPPEISEMLSRVHKGKIISAEHRAAISKKSKGKPKSAETRARMAAAWAMRRAKIDGQHSGRNDRSDGSA